MGNEFAQGREWNHSASLDWHLLDVDFHKGQQDLCRDLNQLYLAESALQYDHQHDGFEWISYDDSGNSILSFIRNAKNTNEKLIILVNFTPNTHQEYRIGVPEEGQYEQVFNSDDKAYTGSDFVTHTSWVTESIASHGKTNSLCLEIPPLAAIALKLKQ
jgi:1,4-alpha-glucan branching enzyme